MYHYLDDKEFTAGIRKLSGEIMQDTCHILKEKYDIGANFCLVGSGARNLITQNKNLPVDLDYNLEILRCGDLDDYRYLKECVRKAFNFALRKHNYRDCEDSTSSLTSKLIYFKPEDRFLFSIDICITARDNQGRLLRLIHRKTGFINTDEYYWNISKNSLNLDKKVRYIKSKGKWNMVREQYLALKNMYLSKNDINHPSFICYIEAVNNVYNSRYDW